LALRGIIFGARAFGEALHRVVVQREQVGHLPIELSEVILDHAELFRVRYRFVARTVRKVRSNRCCQIGVRSSLFVCSFGTSSRRQI
jgi:hypothetical protein